MRRTGFGISLEVPAGWAHAVTRRPTDDPLPQRPPGVAPDAAIRGPAARLERTLPVVHVCTRRLPAGVGDFGSGALQSLGSEDLFVAVVEYGSDVADTGLFARQGVPRLAPSQFSPNRMSQQLPGRSASQHFFSVGGRAFCLYTVLGSHSRRMGTVPRAAAVVATLTVESAARMRAKGVAV